MCLACYFIEVSVLALTLTSKLITHVKRLRGLRCLLPHHRTEIESACCRVYVLGNGGIRAELREEFAGEGRGRNEAPQSLHTKLLVNLDVGEIPWCLSTCSSFHSNLFCTTYSL